MATLAEIRAKLQNAENRSKLGAGGDSAIYPHWNIAEGSSSRLRFLPDGDTTNDYFWIERAMIKLPFAGVKGDLDSKPVVVQVPCMEMWNEACPVLAEVRPWFKHKDMEDQARKYWKKRTYLLQGFVRESALTEENPPENPIRRLVMSPQIFKPIKEALLDPEVEEFPTDFKRGLDFTVTKSSQGGFANYSTSKWSRKESALTSLELEAIEKYGLFDLKSFLPKKPSPIEIAVIKDMFEASVDGQPYDPEKWSQYYKPFGVSAKNPDAEDAVDSTPAARSTAAVADDTDGDVAATSPVVTPAQTAKASTKADDILAMIRNRKAAGN
jgi:hypothetical protein